jgi:hypothetical protein
MNDNKIKRNKVISCKMSYKELRLFKQWKKNNNISTNSIALRTVIARAIEEDL